MPALLEIDNLSTRIRRRRGAVHAVDAVSLSVARGETLGVVGESGCGKTMTALSVMRLLPPGGSIVSGTIRFDGTDLTDLTEREMASVRADRIAMVFQDPLSSLNPTMTIGAQVAETYWLHRDVSWKQAYERAAEVLDLVGIPGARRRMGDYPHQFSGGMRQRVMIGMALACEPDLLMADEPTTALDVTTQREIFALFDDLRSRFEMAMILVTHDLGVIAGRADRVAVMYAGRIVEQASTAELFARPRHRYTEALFGAIPDGVVRGDGRLENIPGLPPDLSLPQSGCRFAARCRYATELCRDEEPELAEGSPGHWLACVHPVPAAAAAVTVRAPSAGKVDLPAGALRARRRDVQLVYQDATSALDPRMRVGALLAEPLRIQRIGNRRTQSRRVAQLLDDVGMPANAVERYPHEFSGGQRQRLALARALALQPKLIVADEPVSALDVSVQAQILNLLAELQSAYSLTYLVISHDLAVVRYLADRIGVMYLGKLVELGARDDVYDRPLHPYTRGLIDAVPTPDPAQERAKAALAVRGELPSAASPPSGCRFRTRCPLAQDVCAEVEPPLAPPGGAGEHAVACHFPLGS